MQLLKRSKRPCRCCYSCNVGVHSARSSSSCECSKSTQNEKDVVRYTNGCGGGSCARLPVLLIYNKRILLITACILCTLMYLRLVRRLYVLRNRNCYYKHSLRLKTAFLISIQTTMQQQQHILCMIQTNIASCASESCCCTGCETTTSGCGEW
jgi:hypothetical protein